MSGPLVVISLVSLVIHSECLHIAYVRNSYSNGLYDLESTLRSVKDNGILVPENVNIEEVILPEKNWTSITAEICSAIENDTVALIVITTCPVLVRLDTLLAPMAIAVLGISDIDHCQLPMTPTSIIRVPKPHMSVPEVVKAILNHGGFTKAAILTDFDVIETSHFRSLLSAAFFESSVTYLESSDALSSVTSWLAGATTADATLTCLLLILGEKSLLKVSRYLSRSEADLQDHVAIIISDTANFSSFNPDGFSVFRDVLLLKTSPSQRNITGTESIRQLQTKNILDTFRLLFEAVLSTKESGSVSARRCEDKHVTISATAPELADNLRQIVQNETIAQGSTYKFDVTRLKLLNRSMTSEEVGTWSRGHGFEVKEGSKLFTARNQGLGNLTLIVGTTEAPPFVRRLPNNTGWEGFCVDILDELASRMNFRYELIPSPDNMWGTVDDEGNWNGVVEMVRREDVDIGIGPISLTSEREEVIDFTKPFTEEGAGIVLKRFEDKNSKIFRMFKPFSETVWLSIAGAVFAVGLALTLVNCLSPGPDKDEGDQTQREVGSGKMKRVNTSDNIWVVYESFMEQGAESSPPNISGRFILGFWWIFTILMVASYKANLVAFLTVSFEDKPINSIHDLADQTAIKPLVKQGSNLYQELKKGETETFRKLWSMMQTAPSITSSEAGLELVLTGGYAFLTDQSQIDFLLTKDCDNLMSAETPFNVGGLGFIVPESSPLLGMLSFNVIQLQEAGLTRKWRQKWWSPSELCPSQKAASNVQSLELESTGGPFLVFVGSTVIAVICLLAECAWFRNRGKCNKSSEVDDNNS